METMELSEALSTLNQKMFYYDWYAKKVAVNTMLYNSIVVYAHRIDAAVYAAVPDKIGNWDVRVHFFASYNANADTFKVAPKTLLEQFATKVGTVPTGMLAATSLTPPVEEVTELTEEDFDVSEEVWQLSKQCGWDALEEIFYEIHDGPNAITERSKDFPGVAASIKELYDLVGFDVLAEEIE